MIHSSFTNPTNGSTNEHHAVQPDKSLEDYVTDKKSHLYRYLRTPPP